MAQSIGSFNRLLRVVEATWGTTPAITPGDMVDLPIQSCSFGASRPLRPRHILGTDRNPLSPFPERVDAGGSIEVLLDGMSHGFLLTDLFGAPATSGPVGGVYTHVWTLSAPPVGASFETGDTIEDLYNVFSGMRCTGATLRVPDVGPIEASFQYAGETDAPDTSSIDSAPTSHDGVPFDLSQAALTVEMGGAATGILTELSLEVDNQPGTPAYVLGGAGLPTSRPLRKPMLRGRVGYAFEDWTVHNLAKAGTATSFEIAAVVGTGDGTAGNETIDILLPEVRLEVMTPGQLVDDAVVGEAPFLAYVDPVSGESLVITIENTVAAYA